MVDYLAHWGLAFPPFAEDAALTLAGVEASIVKARHGLIQGGTAAISGPEGTGKTQAARRLLNDFAQAGWHTAYMPRPMGEEADWLMRLGLPGAADESADMRIGAFTRLENGLRRRHAMGGRTLVAVDDMQLVRDPRPGDLLRALHNITIEGQRVLYCLLAGRSGWWNRSPHLGELMSLCAVHASIPVLSADECLQYLQARLSRAGRAKGVVTKRAALRLASASGGSMRQMNRLMDLALVTGYGLGLQKVTPELVDMAAADLGLPSPSRSARGYDPMDDESVEDGQPVSAITDPGGADDAGDILAMLAAQT